MKTLDTITPGALVRLEGEAVGAPAYATVIHRRGATLRVRWHGQEWHAAGAVVLGADDAARPVVAVRQFEPWQVATDRRQSRAIGDQPGAAKVSGGLPAADPGDSSPAEGPGSNLAAGPVTGQGGACEGEACCHDPPTAHDAPSAEPGAAAP